MKTLFHKNWLFLHRLNNKLTVKSTILLNLIKYQFHALDLLHKATSKIMPLEFLKLFFQKKNLFQKLLFAKFKVI